MKHIINNEMTKPIEGFERYRISESGRIYRVVPINSLERKILDENPDHPYFHECSSKIQTGNGTKYPVKIAGLRRDTGQLSCQSIPFWVMEVFNKSLKKEDRPYFKIHYKDGDPHNCHISNLEYVRRKERNHILKPEDIPVIRGLIADGIQLRRIAKHFGVCEMQINRIKTGENWSKKGRTIFPKKLPFEIDDKSIRRRIRNFEIKKIKDKNQVRYFTVKRSPGKENLIVGTLKGYKFTKTTGHITSARTIAYKLNEYFFSKEIAEKVESKIPRLIVPPVCGK